MWMKDKSKAFRGRGRSRVGNPEKHIDRSSGCGRVVLMRGYPNKKQN